MSAYDQNEIYHLREDVDSQEDIWSEPLIGKSRFLVWSILCVVLAAVFFSMQMTLSDVHILPSLIALLLCMWIVGSALIAGSALLAIVMVFLLHFVAAMSMMVVPVVLIASFYGHLFAILTVRLLFFGSPSRIRPLMFLTVIGVLAYTSATRNVELIQIREAREKNPFVTLEDRLAYERSAKAEGLAATFRHPAAERLEQLDHQWQYRSERVEKLKAIHSSFVERFAGTPGFGVGRMSPQQPLPLPDIDVNSITLSTRRSGEVWPTTIQGSGRRASNVGVDLDSPWVYYPLEINQRVDGFDYHFAASKDFLNPATFGYMNGRREVAGFIEHAFHNAPPSMEYDQRVWSLTQLKLVSMLQFAEPRVYETENLPRMDEISSLTVPTRTLDEFEFASLEVLVKGEETRLQVHGSELRMMGGLRARQQCMECHNADHGELLGAFTYRFVADNISKFPEAPKLTSKKP